MKKKAIGLKQTGRKQFKAGFTLAEVLITLTIIGAAAAITVPALIQHTNKQEYVSALQKTYSTLSQATNEIIAEEGGPKCSEGGWACSTENIYNLYKSKLNILKDCGTGAGCWSQDVINFLNKSSNSGIDNNSAYYKMILADGVQLWFEPVSSSNTSTAFDCTSTNYGTSNRCLYIIADLNGVKKPNTAGRDIFEFAVKSDGLYPMGCDSPRCENTDGQGCACKVLREGAMNY